MNTVTLSESDIELLIEQKLLELLGDPDAGLELKADFLKKIKERLKFKGTGSQRISHEKILEKYGKR